LRTSRLLPFAATAIGIVALLWVVVVGVLLLQEDTIVYEVAWSRRGLDTTLAPGWTRLRVPTTDGLMLDAVLAEPAGRHRMTVLYFHGNAASIWSGQLRDKLLGYQRLGFQVLAIDYRGYAYNAGEPSERGLREDGLAAWQYAVDSLRLAPDHLIVHGMSLGSGVAAAVAVTHPPRLLILDGAYTSMPDVAGAMYPFIPARLLMRNRYPTLARLDSLRAPLLVVHALNDEVIPYDNGLRLFAAAREPKYFLQMSRGHVAGAFGDPPAFARMLDSILR
jgi:pimeloyl-ACP methyl ester carboxylesterase